MGYRPWGCQESETTKLRTHSTCSGNKPLCVFVFCHLDYILKVHKVTKLEQGFGFLNFFNLILFLHQNLHHWICKPET